LALLNVRKLLVVVLLSCLGACAERGSEQPTPEAAKRFLQLRGYNFDGPSFISAVKSGDELAVNGFISAGIDLNVKDENGFQNIGSEVRLLKDMNCGMLLYPLDRVKRTSPPNLKACLPTVQLNVSA